MGTGTGKTVTALTAAVKLLERMPGNRLAVIICCPQTHLVEQWAQENEHFNINFIVGHSKSKQKNYKESHALPRLIHYRQGMARQK